MAYKNQTFADLLYTSYSGLQLLAFAFGNGKNRCDKDCYAFRQSAIRKLKAGEMKIGDLYQNIVRQMTSPHGELSGMDLPFDSAICRSRIRSLKMRTRRCRSGVFNYKGLNWEKRDEL